MAQLTQEIARELLDYDAETGVLTWRHRDVSWFCSRRVQRIWNTKYAGKTAGSLTKYGYVSVGILNKPYQAHRVIFLLLNGYMPEQVDHENHVRADNAEGNLRAANDVINRRNTKKYSNNKSGVVGVHWHKHTRKWRAQIGVDGRPRYLGLFDTVEAASAARAAASRVVGYHRNHGT